MAAREVKAGFAVLHDLFNSGIDIRQLYLQLWVAQVMVVFQSLGEDRFHRIPATGLHGNVVGNWGLSTRAVHEYLTPIPLGRANKVHYDARCPGRPITEPLVAEQQKSRNGQKGQPDPAKQALDPEENALPGDMGASSGSIMAPA